MDKVYVAGLQTAYEGTAYEVLFTQHDLALDWAHTLSARTDLIIRDHTKGEKPHFTTYQIGGEGPEYKSPEDYIFVSSQLVYDDFHNPDWLRRQTVKDTS